MSDLDPFPAYQKPQIGPLERQRVVDYLLRLTAHGHAVQSDGGDYVIPLDDGEVRLKQSGGLWRVSRTQMTVPSTYGDASNNDELDRLVRMALGFGAGAWPAHPQRGRLGADTPASNYRTIASLIGGAEVQAVFDTYLDHEGLAQLIHVLSFGNGTLAPHIRLLGTTATTVGRPGKPARLTKVGVDAWAAQLNIGAEARVLPQRSEHRRFILLDGGRSLLLGPSLNSLQKNEAVSVEDDREDRPFFDQQWARAAPVL